MSLIDDLPSGDGDRGVAVWVDDVSAAVSRGLGRWFIADDRDCHWLSLLFLLSVPDALLAWWGIEWGGCDHSGNLVGTGGPGCPTRLNVIRVRYVAVPAAVVSVLVIVFFIGGDGHAVLGDSDPGGVVRFGAALVRLLADGAGAVCVGALVFAVLIAPARKDGVLEVAGYAAVRTAGRAAVVWFVAAGAMVVLDAADASGQGLSGMDVSKLIGLFDALETAKAWAVTALLALGLVVGCRAALTWVSCVGLAVVAVFALLPPVVSGHASVGAGHDVATDAAIGHVVAAAVWVGALVVLIQRRKQHTDLIRQRYNWLATGCWAVLGVSGVLQGLMLTSWEASRYGLLLLAKVVVLGVLGVVAVWARRRARSEWGYLGIDLVLLGLGMGISVGATRQPPPAFFDPAQTPMDTLIGYDISAVPSVWDFVVNWRFSLVFGTAALVMAVAYVIAVRALRRRGDDWSRGRLVAWLLGCLVLLLATSSGVGRYGPGVFSVHMMTHMALNMLAPVLLVLGAPITLALRVLRPGREGPGPREWLLALLHSRTSRVLTNPLVVCVLLVGSYYALYLTGLFDQAVRWHWAHLLMNTHFLITGYLFYWTVIGIDPGPRRPPHLGRLAMLFAVMPFHAFFGVIVMSGQQVIGDNFYRSLAVPWVGDLLADQHLGGGIAWVSGEVPVLIVVIALLVQWSRADERTARRHDRDPGSEDELAAYNAMLAKLAETRR